MVFEPVDGVPGVVEPAGVDEDDRAERAGEQPVPQEPEPFLAGRAEQVQHHLLVEADPAEVERDGGGGLVGGPPLVSSMAAPAWVIVSSVLSGRISLTERTMVVLPTPNPPTITIFRPLSAVLAQRRRSGGRAGQRLRSPTSTFFRMAGSGSDGACRDAGGGR